MVAFPNVETGTLSFSLNNFQLGHFRPCQSYDHLANIFEQMHFTCASSAELSKEYGSSIIIMKSGH